MSLIKHFIPKSVKKYLKKKTQIIYSADKEYKIIVSNEKSLKDKTAVVTGGNGAIGRAICIKLASEGAKVYCAGRTPETINKVVEEIRSLGLKALPMLIDITDERSVEIAFNKLIDEPIDILVNCAGGGARSEMKELSEQSIEIIDEVLNTNLRGTILCTRKAAQKMKERKSGKIIIISSTVGIGGKAKYSEYAAAKAGLIGFMKSMALELGEYGINVNCVSPGYIQRGEFSSDREKWLKGTNCLHQVGSLEDVANAVYFMCGRDSEFITGQNLLVDGGRSLGLYGDH